MTLPMQGGPLRIGLVTPAWPGTHTANGIASAVFHLAAGLERGGHEVTILTRAIDAPQDHPRVIPVPPPRLTLLDRVQRRLNLEKWLRTSLAKRYAEAITEAQTRYGVEIVVMEETQGWIGETRKLVSIPMVATLHGPWWLHRSTGSAANDADITGLPQTLRLVVETISTMR